MAINIRIDDFPYCLPNSDLEDCKRKLCDMFAVLRAYPVKYILGAIPFYCSPQWLDIADAHMGNNGGLVMHGFTHLHDRWREKDQSFALGGEFAGMTEAECLRRYANAYETMYRSIHFDSKHFIAPFNCYTQELINAISSCVSFIHTCDKEWNQFGYAKYNYGSIRPVVGQLYKDYDFAHQIRARLVDCEISPEWVTLHWWYEYRHYGIGWLRELHRLCEECCK